MALGDKKNVPWSVNGILADAGGDIRVAAASIPTAGGASIEASLSTKANINNGHFGGNIDELRSSGVWVCVNASGTLPPGFSNWFTLAAFPGGTGSVIQIASLNVGQNMPNRTCIRHHNGAGWDAWGPIATATKPQEYDLPLAAGFAEYIPCRYWVAQDREVKTAIRVAFNAVASGQVCATIPPGYRPSSTRSVTFTAQLNNAPVVHGHADLNPDGSIKLYPYGPITTPGSAILNQFVFVAAD